VVVSWASARSKRSAWSRPLSRYGSHPNARAPQLRCVRHVVEVDGDRARLHRLRVNASQTEPSPDSFDVEVFFDGDCPLCVREIRMLRKLDATRRRIRFTDIQSSGFNAAELGITYRALMDRIHARLPGGELVSGVEVFRRLYAAVGFERLVAVSRLRLVAKLLDFAYELFAKYRLRLTGRCTPELCAPAMKR